MSEEEKSHLTSKAISWNTVNEFEQPVIVGFSMSGGFDYDIRGVRAVWFDQDTNEIVVLKGDDTSARIQKDECLFVDIRIEG